MCICHGLISPERRQNGTGKSLKAVTWHFFKRKISFRHHSDSVFLKRTHKIIQRKLFPRAKVFTSSIIHCEKRLLWLLKFSHVNDSRFWLSNSNALASHLISLRRLHRELYSTVTDASWKETKLDCEKRKALWCVDGKRKQKTTNVIHWVKKTLKQSDSNTWLPDNERFCLHLPSDSCLHWQQHSIINGKFGLQFAQLIHPRLFA